MTMFSVTISERPAVKLYGLTVSTDMAKAPVECHNLWEKDFAPRMQEICGKQQGEYKGETYGVCVMLDAQRFDYWAAMPACEGCPLPDGMKQFDLPGGLYASCQVPSMNAIGDAYAYLYETWPQTQTEYIPNMQAPCFEYYDARFCESGVFAVYIPLLKK